MLIDYGMRMFILKMLLNKLNQLLLVILFKEILVLEILEEKHLEKFEANINCIE